MSDSEKPELVYPPGYESPAAKRNIFGTLRSLSAILAGFAAASIPVVVVLVGNMFTTAINVRNRETRFIEIAVNVLSDKPTEANKPLREWAVEILVMHSPVELTKRQQQLLVEEETILNFTAAF
ncbi:MAG: hypothetical protein IH991_09455 [Planctomycetes bacterium]|nr:hypothetical protein [Planctomycetota bacterium]